MTTSDRPLQILFPVDVPGPGSDAVLVLTEGSLLPRKVWLQGRQGVGGHPAADGAVCTDLSRKSIL